MTLIFLIKNKNGRSVVVKKCKYCQSEIDAKAKICPHCSKKQNSIKKWIFLGVFFLLFIIVFSSNDNTDEINTSSTGGSVTGEQQNNSSNSVKAEKFSYEVTNAYSDDYGFAYYIEGIVKNNKDKDYSYVQISFNCYDAEGNNLGTAMDNTNNLLGNETWKFKAMAMFSDAENVDHCDFYEVTGW